MATWEPSADDVRRVFTEQNPWHVGRGVPDVLAPPTERPLAQHLWRHVMADEPRRFHVVLGPRRVGKTTAMYQTVRHLLHQGVSPGRLWWLRLDHPILLNVPLDGLVRLIIQAADAAEGREVILFLDELVYAKDWQLWLKTFYDERWPVRILATSSATAALRNERLESGIGRWSEHFMLPYSFTEYLDLTGQAEAEPIEIRDDLETTLRAMRAIPDLDEQALAEKRRRFLLVGGFPELLTAASTASTAFSTDESQLLRSQMVLRSDAVERAVYKDIPQSFGIENPMLLERLLYTLAGQFTGVLSASNLCRELDGMSQPTFDRYLRFLEQAYLVFRLTNYSGNESTVQKRGRKLYFFDGAVRNAALQRGIGPLSNPDEMGLLQENMTAAALNALGIQTGVRVHYWRDGSKEVDLVYDHPTSPLAFELASSPKHRLAGLEAFQATHPRFRNRCYLVAPGLPLTHPERSSRGVGQIPLDRFLLTVGRLSGDALRDRVL